MRKALIALVVATALFAVGAFAASFIVQSEDIASGSNPVSACAPNVDIDFDAPTANASTGAWEVSGATARFYTTAAGNVLATACDGYTARLAITAPAVVTFPGQAVVASGAVHFDFVTPYAVSAITQASVVVDGKTLTANV